MAMILLTAFVPLPLGFLANAHVGTVVLARAWPFVVADLRGRTDGPLVPNHPAAI
jgi:hypothetical protein